MPSDLAELRQYLGHRAANRLEQTEARLVALVTKGWVEGEASYHLHVRIGGITDELISHEFCALYQRERPDGGDDALDENCVGVPAEERVWVIDFRERHMDQEALVLVEVDELVENGERTSFEVPSVVRLRLADDCPRQPLRLQPLKGTLPGLCWRDNGTAPISFRKAHRELGMPSWVVPTFPDKLIDGVIESGPQVGERVPAKEQGRRWRWLRQWFDHCDVPFPFAIYTKGASLGVRIKPDMKGRVERIQVFVGAPELRPSASQRSHEVPSHV